MKFYVKKVYGVTLPEKGTDVSAGYDIIATSDPKIVGEQIDAGWKTIGYIEYETNLFIAPEYQAVHALIHPRSSISKYHLILANSIGLVDNDYRGMLLCRFKYIWQPEDYSFEYQTVPQSDGTTGIITQSPIGLIGKINMDKIYKKGDKIAQLVGEQTLPIEWELVDDLTQTRRGEGGFGSSDRIGKPLTEVFSEEQKKYEALKSEPKPVSPILDKYKEAGGVPTPIPYTELIKNRPQI